MRARGAIVASMLENLPEEHAAELLRRGIVPIHRHRRGMDAAEAAAFIGRGLRAPVLGPPLRGVALRASSTLPPFRGERTTSVDEAAAKALLASAGLPVPPGRRAATAEEAVAVAAAHSVSRSR